MSTEQRLPLPGPRGTPNVARRLLCSNVLSIFTPSVAVIRLSKGFVGAGQEHCTAKEAVCSYSSIQQRISWVPSTVLGGGRDEILPSTCLYGTRGAEQEGGTDPLHPNPWHSYCFCKRGDYMTRRHREGGSLENSDLDVLKGKHDILSFVSHGDSWARGPCI